MKNYLMSYGKSPFDYNSLEIIARGNSEKRKETCCIKSLYRNEKIYKRERK